METTRALEEYLKTIYILKRKGHKVVRVRDIAKKMNVKMSSVTDALKRLSREDLVEYQKREYVDLTKKGKRLAEKLYKRWTILFFFFSEVLGVSKDIANDDACKVEHTLSDQTINALKVFISKNFKKEKTFNELELKVQRS
ncbi:MAG: metal-dependent transcriptional regulator [Candidatus Njordarchaeia archaeon]|nr:metal-dependent transcriptional regulator [Candidatus Korarchaeota archaeon]